MLIATITALAILFGGGTFETFFIDDLRKGVKEYVVEDERKDEILDDLKRSKKMICLLYTSDAADDSVLV